MLTEKKSLLVRLLFFGSNDSFWCIALPVRPIVVHIVFYLQALHALFFDMHICRNSDVLNYE